MMIRINNLSDLDRAVANKICHEPPLSKRRAIHESGVWRWVDNRLGNWCILCRMLREQCAECCSRAPKPHWSPAPFTTCPVASKWLRDRMRRGDRWWRLFGTRGETEGWSVTLYALTGPTFAAWHNSLEVAIALAAARALGLELELVEGWDQQ